MFTEVLTPILHNLLQKIEEGGNTFQFILWSEYYVDTKIQQRQYKKRKEKRKLQTNIPHEYRHKNPLKAISKYNSTIYNVNYTLWPNDFRNASLVEYSKFNQCNHSNKLKKKNHMIISINVQKFDNIQHEFMVKTLR